MPSTFTPNKGIEEPASGDYVNAWAAPVNANWTALDTSLGGTTSISVTSVPAGTIALTLTQYRPPNIEFSGVLTGNLNYQIPAGVGGLWTISNAATGAFMLQFSIASGNAITLASGRTLIISDGASISLAQTPYSAGPLIPANDAAYDIGSLSFRWRNLFLSGGATVDGALSAGATTVTSMTVGAFSLSPQQMVLKRTTTSRANTTTATADPDLQISLTTGTYSVEIWLNDSGGVSTGGMKGSLSYTGSLVSNASLWGMVGSGTGTVPVPLVTVNVSAQQMQSSQNGVSNMWLTGVVAATGSGVLSFNWAQQTSNATASIIASSSWMRVTKLS